MIFKIMMDWRVDIDYADTLGTVLAKDASERLMLLLNGSRYHASKFQHGCSVIVWELLQTRKCCT